MTVINKLKLIRVEIKGEQLYIRGTSIFGEQPTADPLQARNYADDNLQLEKDIHNLHLEGDEIWPKSGIKVDSIRVVEFEVRLQEVANHPGRQPVKDRNVQR